MAWNGLVSLPAIILPLVLGGSAAAAMSPAAGSPVPDGWLDQAQRGLAAQEYELTWQERPVLKGLDAAWQAPNRAQGFRTYFTPEGIRVVPRTEAEPSWMWGLSLVSYGRGQTVWPLGEARLSPTGNRLDSRRGTVDEWYVNEPRGLKQGFELWAAPEEAAGQGGHAPLAGRVTAPGRARGLEDAGLVHLDLELEGELLPVVAADGQAIDFVTPAGARALRYAELVVTDARGEVLPAWMEGVADGVVRGIRLVVDDHEAVYPITIDPLATSPNWMVQGAQPGAILGSSVGTAGDVNGDGYSDVIVGAEGYDNGQTDEGRAFVYHGSASGLSLTANWTAESNQAGAAFGHAAATAGDVNGDGFADVIVGAYVYDNDQTDEGRAFVYHGSASGLSLTSSWTAESNGANAFFGWSVSTAGDVNGDGYSDVIVGARQFTNGQSNEGRAHVYHGSASGLSLTPNSTAESNQATANFGYSVGTAGDVNGDGYSDVIVGASGFDNDQVDEGRAFVYHGSVSGISSTSSWMAESNDAGAQFGIAAGTAGDVNGDGYADVIVGAWFFENGQTEEGGAFVYYGGFSGLSPTPAWTGEGGQASSRYGYAAGTAGDVNGDGYADVIVGAYAFSNGQINEGRAFVYHGSATGLPPAVSWTAESDWAGAAFGLAVATAGDVNGDGYSDVIVGATDFATVDPNPPEGRAYVYHGSASGPATSAGWTAESNQSNALFGHAVGTAGDVNGDGFTDVIVGAYLYDGGTINAGRAFVYHGSASGLSPTSSWTADGSQQLAFFGYAVGTAGDVNGDGYSDVIVGAYQFDNGQTDEGRAYVYHGSASGLSLTPSWTAESDQVTGRFGFAVGTAGDVNGDGYADVVVGAAENPFTGGDIERGRAYVYYGSSSGLATTSGWMAEGDQAQDNFGCSVGTAGDVNGDGFADVIVGSHFGGSSDGRAFVYHGSASGVSPTSNWMAESNSSALFGHAVGTAGDVNGDGYADVIVGAITFANGEAAEGRAFVYHGSAAGLSSTPNWTAESDQLGANFGSSVSTAGDVNGDGYADVIVGAYHFDNGQTDEGRAYVYHGSASGLSLTSSWTAESDQTNAFFGLSASTVGDVNGDGYADVVAGASEAANGQSREGRAFVYYGNGGPGLSLRPQQRRGDNSAPVAPLGGIGDNLRLSVIGRAPFGRTLVRLERELKPLGVSFNGAATQMSDDWIDIGTAGAGLDDLVVDLTASTVYHWRLRLRYHPTTSPFQSYSRWFTVPLNGWQEGDLRTLPAADLAVTQTDANDPVFFGPNLTYTVEVSNAGPQAAPSVPLRDTLPPGSTFVAASPSQGTCSLPAGGVLTCELGSLAVGIAASVTVTVTPGAPGSYTNTAEVSYSGDEVNVSNNLSSETTTVLPMSPGDRAWEDTDGDGVQDPGEPGLADVLVALYDGAGIFLDATVTDLTGAYSFPNQTLGATYRLRFFPPTGYVPTLKDQGGDDLFDSDADPLTLLTSAFVLTSFQDPFRWDVGMLPACFPPDEPVYIANATMTVEGYPILHIQDPNQLRQVTGYNIYRSGNPSLPPASWPLLATDVVDMDAGTPNMQWVDSSGDPPPGEVWFYNATAYNHDCPAEGPF